MVQCCWSPTVFLSRFRHPHPFSLRSSFPLVLARSRPGVVTMDNTRVHDVLYTFKFKILFVMTQTSTLKKLNLNLSVMHSTKNDECKCQNCNELKKQKCSNYYIPLWKNNTEVVITYISYIASYNLNFYWGKEETMCLPLYMCNIKNNDENTQCKKSKSLTPFAKKCITCPYSSGRRLSVQESLFTFYWPIAMAKRFWEYGFGKQPVRFGFVSGVRLNISLITNINTVKLNCSKKSQNKS